MSVKTAYSVKPLKGILNVNTSNISGVIGNDTVFTKQIVPAILSENGVNNVTITDSVLINCIIGLGSATEAFFTLIHANNDVEFLGLDPTQYTKWDSATGELSISGSLKVTGCSYLDNIEICKNYIRADNLNGDISIFSNNLGSIFLQGGIIHNATSGNYSSIISNGSNIQVSRNTVTITSSSESLLLTSAKDTVIKTLNGSIFLNTDTTNTTKLIFLIDNTSGNIRVNTNNHNVRTGDIITLTSSLFNGNYTVGNVINSSQFLIGTSGSFSNINSASYKKENNNDILLNASRRILIPENIPLTFSNTNNSIIQNSTSGIILTSLDNFTFSSCTQNSLIKIPETTFLQFGSTTGNTIRLNTNGNLSLRSVNDTLISGINLTISSTNVSMTDPIITIAKGNTTVNDTRDRGIEYNWFDTTSNTTKLGWFGYKHATKLLSFIPDATNVNEVISGSIGNFAINSVNATSITLNPNGSLNANCGSLTNVREITACGNNLNVLANNINLNVNSKINLDTIGSFITSNTLGTLSVNSTVILFSTGSILIPQNTKFTFDGTTNGNLSIIGSTGNISINSSNGNINLNSAYININGSLVYSIDRYILQSGILDFKSPDLIKGTTLFKVIGPNYTTSSGTMGTLNVRDGSVKTICCSGMGTGCVYTLQFSPGTFIAPNALNINPSKLVFKRQGQGVQLIFNAIDSQWVLISCNAYVF